MTTAALDIQQGFMGKYKLTLPKMCVRTPRSTARRLFGLKGEKNLTECEDERTFIQEVNGVDLQRAEVLKSTFIH